MDNYIIKIEKNQKEEIYYLLDNSKRNLEYQIITSDECFILEKIICNN